MVTVLAGPAPATGLLERARQGDGEAFRSLLAPHLSGLNAAARRLSPAEADDLVSETLSAAFTSLGSLEREGAMWTWLFRILIHKHYDLLRRRHRERSLPAPETPTPFPEEDREVVRAAVESLPSDQRRVLELRYFEGMTSIEIGRTLGMPAGTVRSILFHAVRTFEAAYRRRLEE